MFRSSAKLPMYHGTAAGKTNEILRSILKNGLVPDPVSKAYRAPYSEEDAFDDLDLETETSMRLDESLGGAYLTTSFPEATKYAKHAQESHGGRLIVVSAQIETRTPEVKIDEDFLINYCFDFVNAKFDADDDVTYYLELYEWLNTGADWKSLARAWLTKNFPDVKIHANRWQQILPAMAVAMQSVSIVTFLQNYEREAAGEAYETGDDWEEDSFQEIQDHVDRYKESIAFVSDRLTEIATPTQSGLHNIRILKPVGYRGANHIKAVVSWYYPRWGTEYHERYVQVGTVHYARTPADAALLIKKIGIDRSLWQDVDGLSIIDKPIQLQRATGAVLHGADTAPTQEMLDFFEQRTDQHIDCVKKYMLLLDGFEGLTSEELWERAEQHDADKRDPELKLPYVWITEYYRAKNSGEDISASLQQRYDDASEASEQHVQQNLHHPEAHGSIEDMDTLDLVEMVADWSAMAEELDEGSARGWADKNVGAKWKFSSEQKRLIYKAIDRLEAAIGDKQVAASVVFRGVKYDLVLASVAEKEVEGLLLNVLPGSPFAHKTFAVGGYVRDEVMGLQSKDLDLVVEIPDGAEKLARYLHNQFPNATSNPYQLGKGYPIWHIVFKKDVEFKGTVFQTKGAELDLADTQKEAFPDPESRQRITQYGSLDEDSVRRDFTVNMLLKDMTDGSIVDPSGTGVQDIKNGILRIHPDVPVDRPFTDDPLRMLRLIRFAAKYGWTADHNTKEAVRRNAHRIEIVSGERIRDELVKIMKLGKLHAAIEFMDEMGLLEYMLPEIHVLKGVEQPKEYHAEGDVYRHTLLVLQHAKPTVDAQLAALLHDVGKPATQTFLEDKIQFLGHDKVSGEIAEAVLRRLRFDGNIIQRIRRVVENHMRPHFLDVAGPKAIRKFMRELVDELDEVLDLAEADELSALGPGGKPSKQGFPGLRQTIKEIQEAPVPVQNKPVLSGKEVMRILDIPSGPEVGEVLRWLQDQQDEYAVDGKSLDPVEAERLLLEHFGA